MAKRKQKEGAPELIPVPPQFITAVARMRFYQAQYFRTRDKGALIDSKKWEKETDKYLDAISPAATVAAAVADCFPGSEIVEEVAPPPPPPPPARPVVVIKLCLIFLCVLFFSSCGDSVRTRYVCNCSANKKIEDFMNSNIGPANNMSDEEMEDVLRELYMLAVKINCKQRKVLTNSDGQPTMADLNLDSCEHVAVPYFY